MKQIVEVRELLKSRIMEIAVPLQVDERHILDESDREHYSHYYAFLPGIYGGTHPRNNFPGHTVTLDELLDFFVDVMEFEGCRLKPYVPKGEKLSEYLTVGFGHTFLATDYQRFESITLDTAVKLFVDDMYNCAAVLYDFCVGANALSYGEFAKDWDFSKSHILHPINRRLALLDFVYNCGFGALANSTLFKYILEDRDNAQICKQFMRWKYSGSVILSGLEKRCKFRCELWKK